MALRVVVAFVLLFTPARALAQGTTALFFESQAGEWIGAGETKTYTPADGTFSATSASNSVTIRVSGSSFSFWWDISFSAPTGTSLETGTYNTARRYPLTSLNGLSMSGTGRGCNTLTGRFVILEAVYGSGGSVQRFAADFEQHCEDGTPGLFGAVRYNSTISTLAPFGGNYPRLSLDLMTPLHGTISSAGGLLCGSAGSNCSQTFTSASDVTVTATPDPGYIFAGWLDDCRGGPVATVRVNSPRQCGARFEPAASADPRTLFVFDSRPGDSAGGGKAHVYSPLNSRIVPQWSSASQTLSFTVISVDATREVSWSLRMAPRSGEHLVVGTYEGALSNAGRYPGLQAGSCTNVFGRFVVRELVIESGGTVTRAAVDLEQHCPNEDAGFFAAIRYNSTIADTVPFDGSYPFYQLLLTAPANGTITGGDLSCGVGGSECELNPLAPTSVSLTATPAAGYVFAGWTGAGCLGSGSTLTVRVNSRKLCSAVFESVAASATPRTRILLDYLPESRGAGTAATQEAFSSLSTQVTATSSSEGRVLLFDVAQVTASGFSTTRRFGFSGVLGRPLTAGSYMAVRYPFANASAGMDVTSSCSRLTGRFVILELVRGSNGSVERAAIDFEQHCEDADAAVFGVIRFNSTLSANPFGGDYPRYRFQVSRPSHGSVSGSGLDCGAATDCVVDRAAPGTVSVVATADPDYVFAGWTGACHGGESITFRLNSVRECGATFVPANDGPRTLLKLVSQPGDIVLQGRTEVYSLANSIWNTWGTGSAGSSLSFTVVGRTDTDESHWNLTFRATSSETLVPGTYTNASSSFTPTQPVLWIYGPSSCSVQGSTFTVRTLVFDAQGKLLRAAIDFEQHCTSISSPALTGTIEYDVNAADVGRMSLDKSALSFASTTMPDNTIGNTTAPQKVRLSQSPGPNVSWTATTSVGWLRVSPSSGTGPAELTVSVQPGIAGIGTHTGTVTVTAASQSLPPLTVTWTLHPETTAAPFGRFETPVSMSENLTGAVALTGWALDDVEVTSVQIWRLPHPADPPAAIFQGLGPQNGKIFIGNATFIDGARPDVEAAFALPNRSRAGWGYMMLTRGLIWDGHGLFTVHAIATDREGHVAEIGSTAFSVNNALATKPFGTIDTPGQGAVAFGVYPNTGWVLTPNGSATIPAGNVTVMIDGVALAGTPSMAPRADITAFFPGMDTSQAGRGLFIDTSAYADGLHTIAWVVTDSAGQTDGIGSRFFQVANSTGSLKTVGEVSAVRSSALLLRADLEPAAQAFETIAFRTGFDPAEPFETLDGAGGLLAVEMEELDRVEVRFPGSSNRRGYLKALGELRPLPPGASFNPTTGTFTWQPAAGFLGAYQLVFVGESGGANRRDLTITIRPRQQ